MSFPVPNEYDMPDVKYNNGDVISLPPSLSGDGTGVNLSQLEKNLILTLFSKAAYAEDDASAAYDTLENLWTTTTRTITYNLTHVTSSNTTESIESGQSYTTSLTADTDYTMNTVTVTMGGEDVTDEVYSSGTVTIPSVTGNIVITATAELPLQSITASYTQRGTVYDTDSLDSLKADLVVTANYVGGTSETVPSSDYTLSGTLVEGTSTITVSYEGKTTTFTVNVSSVPSVYPLTLTDSSEGVGFGSVDITKPTNTPPYVGSPAKSRFHCIGDNTGYPITAGKTYTITISGTAGTEYCGMRSFNVDGEAQLSNLQVVSNANNYDTGWTAQSTTQKFTFTPQQINGKDPVCFWLTFKKDSAGTGQWSTVNDLLPITIEEA